MVKNSEMIASRKIKTEPGTVIPRVQPVIKQEYMAPIRKSTNSHTSRQPAWHRRNYHYDENTEPKQTESFGKRNPLEAACHTEKSQIEAKKHRYDTLQLTSIGDSLQVTAHKIDNGHLVRAVDLKSADKHEETVKGLVKILETSEIDTFELSELISPGSRPKMLTYWPEIERCGPFRFKTVKSNEGTSINLQKLLENCEGVENILLNTSCCNGQAMMNLVSLPAVINFKVLQVTSRRADFVYSLAKKWVGINIKVPIKSIGFSSSPLAIPFIAYKFGDRVIYKKVNEVRIRTDDVSKHILIRRNKDSMFGSLFSSTVIPSNLLESEFERSSWFKELTALGSAYEDFTDFE